MAVGDLEGKIGELNGQLRVLAPILEGVGQKVSRVAEKIAQQEENLKQVWIEINALKERNKEGSSKGWQVLMSVASAVIGVVATLVVARLTKGGP